MMNRYIQSLMQNYGQKDFKNFAAYVYTTLQKEIDVSKGKQKDKYIKVRKSILSYIFSNERVITSELRKNKIK
jgi:hypothetical protein